MNKIVIAILFLLFIGFGITLFMLDNKTVYMFMALASLVIYAVLVYQEFMEGE